jgi:uncharacterized membrane protein
VRQLIILWFATLFFGLAVFLVGKFLQASERKRRVEKMAAKERAQVISQVIAREMQQQSSNIG